MGSILLGYRFRVLFFVFLFLSFDSVAFSIQVTSYKEAFEQKSTKDKKQKRKKIKETNKNVDKDNNDNKSKENDIFLDSDHERLYNVKTAKTLFAEAEYTRAFVILKKILEKTPEDKEANFLLARIYTYSKEYRKASFYFLKGSDYYLDASSGYDYGVSFYMVKDYPRAIKGFRRVDENASFRNIVNFYIGVCYLEMNRLPLALIFLKKAKDLPSNYKNIQDKYIQYIEANLNDYDQKVYKKRVRKITRKELPELPRIKKDKTTKSYSVEYEAPVKKAKEQDSSRVFEVTPFIDQSINLSNYEYSSEVLTSSYYKYKGGLNFKLEPVFSSSSSKQKGVSFSIPLDTSIDSFGVVMFSSDSPAEKDRFVSNVASSFYMYESSSDFKKNSSLDLKLSPRLEVGMGKISNFWVEYDYTYNIRGFDPEYGKYTHEAWLGFDKLGSSKVYVDVSSGFESFLALDAQNPAHIFTSNLSLNFNANSINKFKLATDFYYGLEKEGKEKEGDNYKVCVYDASSYYVCDGINSWISGSYELHSSEVSFGINLEYSLPVGGDKRVDSSSISVNSNFKYIGSKYFGLYVNAALSNLTLDNAVYETSSGFSITPVSTLYLNLDFKFKYLKQYEYKLYSDSFDSYQTKTTEKGGFTVNTTPSILYEPFKWLGLGLKFEYVYNEFSIPEEDENNVYFWHPNDDIGADFSHYNLVFNIKLSYTF